MKVAIIDDERIYLDQIKILLKEYDRINQHYKKV